MRLKIRTRPKPVMNVSRAILRNRKGIYLLLGPKPTRYPRGRSRIWYIGRTKRGADRIAASAANKASEILQARGVRRMDVHAVSCTRKKGMKGWEHLERAFIALFKERYGRIPTCNRTGSSFRFSDKLHHLFARRAIERVLESFETSPQRLPGS
jgi:hypothetical protein